MQYVISYKKSKIAYTDIGKGNPIVLLHGFLENATMWKYIADNLSKKNRVICIDLLGHGNSGAIGKIHGMKEMAFAVKAVLNFLNINRFYMVGHSMGGYVSLTFAEKYPKEIKGICLLNSTAQADTEDRKKLRLRACKMAEKNYENLLKMSVSNLFTSEVKQQFPQEIIATKKQASHVSVQNYIATAKGMLLRENKETVLQTIDKRLIIAGVNDSILNYQSSIEEAKRTNTPLHELKGGHMSHIENKEALLKILHQFIDN